MPGSFGFDPFSEENTGTSPPGAAQNAYSWAWNFFTGQGQGQQQQEREREQTENAQFADVFEEMLREEGMAETGTSQPTGKFWGVLGGISGGALGFIVANVPGLVAGVVAGNRLGAVRDAKGKSVYAVFQVSDHDYAPDAGDFLGMLGGLAVSAGGADYLPPTGRRNRGEVERKLDKRKERAVGGGRKEEKRGGRERGAIGRDKRRQY